MCLYLVCSVQIREVLSPLFTHAIQYQKAEDSKQSGSGGSGSGSGGASSKSTAMTDVKDSKSAADAEAAAEKPDPVLLAASYELIGVCWVPATTTALHAIQTQHSEWMVRYV